MCMCGKRILRIKAPLTALKIPVWWRRAVLPSLPWVVCFLSFFSRLARTSTTKGTADNGPLWAVEEAVILLRPRPPFPTLPWLRLLILKRFF